MSYTENKPFLENLWRWKCGLPEKDLNEKPKPINIEELKETEWSPEFEKLMRNRLVMGALRYGKMAHNGEKVKGKPNYDRVKSIRKRLSFYEESGNLEWLVDVGNLALLMFEERTHPNAHFEAGDDGYHDEIIK